MVTPVSNAMVQLKLLHFLIGRIVPRDLEGWVYEANELESLLGPAAYSELAGQDFGARDAAPLRALVRREFDRLWPGEFDRARIRDVCESIINGSTDIVSGCRTLARLAREGIDGVGVEFVGFDSELDGVPTPDKYVMWEPNALKAQLESVEVYRSAILAAVREALSRSTQGA